MILPKGHSDKYLKDYREGRIPMGLGLGCLLDENFLHKHGQLNFILGHDNVGKTYFIEWCKQCTYWAKVTTPTTLNKKN